MFNILDNLEQYDTFKNNISFIQISIMLVSHTTIE